MSDEFKGGPGPDGLHIKPWDEDLCLWAVGASPFLSRDEKVDAFQEGLESGALSEYARLALVEAGYHELDD